ncbi:hypothetical protein [Brevundimonas sp. KM4]|uniref:hypothetical protein n=1 Tax=Brevundimonas sp. KM4 TaxID=1628191 RepID=UPI00061FBECB|nr:hypothetical protein [Brevundimonas sp. KM4]KJV37679.1 hypothetical protein VH88_15200 [Brevundimonas sp. KM4]
MPQIVEVFEEMDIAEVSDVRTVGAVYWSFPAAQRQGLCDDINLAAASSYTVERQREQIAKLATWCCFEVRCEVAVQFDPWLGLSDDERGRLARFLQGDFDAAVIVAHDALNRWRPNKGLETLLRSTRTLRVYPPSDLVDHFIWNRHWKQQSTARAAARRARTRYRPILDGKQTAAYRAYVQKRIERWPDWESLTRQQRAERLTSVGVRTITGLRFNVERLRDFEESLGFGRGTTITPVGAED